MAEMTDYPSLDAALAAFQAKLPPIKKSDTARVKTKAGDTYTYTYADLADVSAIALPLLGAVGLSWSTRPTLNEAGKFVLVYRLAHVSGGELVGEWPLPPAGTFQEYGSAITYVRRYALCCVTGIAPADQDDDGAKGRSVNTWQDRAPSREWDQAEQEILYVAWLAEIRQVPASKIDEIGRKLIAAKATGELSPDTYERLFKVGAARKAELKKAVTSTEILESQGDWPDVAVPK